MIKNENEDDEELFQVQKDDIGDIPRVGETLTFEIYNKDRDNEHHNNIHVYKVSEINHEIFQNNGYPFHGEWFHFVYICLTVDKTL